MSEAILTGLIALLMGAVGLLSYTLGKRTQKNATFETKEKTMAEIRHLRDSLSDPAVVDELHDRFKR